MLGPNPTTSNLMAKFGQPHILQPGGVLDHILEVVDVGEVLLELAVKLIDSGG